MKRLFILSLGLIVVMLLNVAQEVSAQEADQPTVQMGEPPAEDPHGQPMYGTRGNPWTGVMQQWLRDNRFRPGPVDLWFGRQTEAAVYRFQQAAAEQGIYHGGFNGVWDWETSQAQQAYVAPPVPVAQGTPYGVWDRLAQCESNGNWSINTGNGFYGGLQFTLGSWRAAGGSGYPHQNSREEQIRVAENLLRMQGWGAWPTCSRIIGVR